MKKPLLIIIVIIIIATSSLIFFFRVRPAPTTEQQSVSNPQSSNSLTKDKEYSNSTYKFSLKMPEDFVAREARLEESYTILLENKKGEGIQILISPFEDIKVLTREMISRDLPELKVSGPQVIEIKDGYKGLLFTSDNQSFAGASREIWFVFHGNLYQISTLDKFGDILKDIFNTWEFTQ